MQQLLGKRRHFSHFLDFIWNWTLRLKKIFGLCLELDRVLTNQDWIWTEKYDSLPISEAEVVTDPVSSEISDLLLHVSLQGCSRASLVAS